MTLSLDTLMTLDRTAHAGPWRLERYDIASVYADTPFSLSHYGTTLARWEERAGLIRSVDYLSAGFGSVSDANGLNTLFTTRFRKRTYPHANLFRMDRDRRGGGPRITVTHSDGMLFTVFSRYDRNYAGDTWLPINLLYGDSYNNQEDSGA